MAYYLFPTMTGFSACANLLTKGQEGLLYTIPFKNTIYLYYYSNCIWSLHFFFYLGSMCNHCSIPGPPELETVMRSDRRNLHIKRRGF